MAGIPQGKASEEDVVNVVKILLEHGANLTFTTYQVNFISFNGTSWGDIIARTFHIG